MGKLVKVRDLTSGAVRGVLASTPCRPVPLESLTAASAAVISGIDEPPAWAGWTGLTLGDVEVDTPTYIESADAGDAPGTVTWWLATRLLGEPDQASPPQVIIFRLDAVPLARRVMRTFGVEALAAAPCFVVAERDEAATGWLWEREEPELAQRSQTIGMWFLKKVGEAIADSAELFAADVRGERACFGFHLGFDLEGLRAGCVEHGLGVVTLDGAAAPALSPRDRVERLWADDNVAALVAEAGENGALMQATLLEDSAADAWASMQLLLVDVLIRWVEGMPTPDLEACAEPNQVIRRAIASVATGSLWTDADDARAVMQPVLNKARRKLAADERKMSPR